ncbi:MAG: DNA methyltransferase [Dysgonomonas sp.]|uniref:DNA methyltransferase n=1 Tax=Dysgonomonas sp. TaxID=1891233 RepID=UPI0039E56919
MLDYDLLLKQKVKQTPYSGFEINHVNNNAFPFQAYVIKLMLKMGRGAVFADCGLGKTLMQLDIADQICKYIQCPVIILAPFAVTDQTIDEGLKFGITVNEYSDTPCNKIYINNYDQIDNIDFSLYGCVILDESSILKNYVGKTKQKLITECHNIKYKYCFTATPSPNDFEEIGNHSEFLGVLDAADMRQRFFVRDNKLNEYRLKEHARKDFFAWIKSWSVMFSNPADLGFDGTSYVLPKLHIIEDIIKTEKTDNGLLFHDTSVSATTHSKELKRTIDARMQHVANIVNNSPDFYIVWVKLNDEADILKKMIPDAVEVRGSEKPEIKKAKLRSYRKKEYRVLITKKKIAQFGLNFQHCHLQIDASTDFSFEALYQAIRRSYRYGVEHDVIIRLVLTEAMQNVIDDIRTKMKNFEEMKREVNKAEPLEYKLTSEYNPREVRTDHSLLIKGDSCVEIDRFPDNSFDFSVFSPPFKDLYTYSSSIRDLGNCADDQEFFAQYRIIVQKLFNKMKPGRLVAVHTKDLAVYKGSSGYTGLNDFTGENLKLFEECGFKYHSKIAIWTDPVLEMQRTKTQRLLYKQLRTDSSLSGVGLPEYLTIFRKWDGVEDFEHIPINNKTSDNFPLDTWQDWASPIFRKNLMNYEKSELASTIIQMKAEIFMLKYGCNPDLPEDWYSDAWFDIRRTDVLNGQEGTAQGDEKHICPLQLEVIRRAILMWSNPGETVFTPFGGIGSEPYISILNNRKAISIELKDSYFDTSVINCRKAEIEVTQKLFTEL